VPFPVDRPVFVDRPVDRPVFIDRPVDRPVPFPVDRPVPFPVFLRERTTWVPQTTWEQVEAPQFQRPVPPIYSFEKPRRDIDVRTGLFGHVRSVRVGETEVRIGPFGKLREVRSR